MLRAGHEHVSLMHTECKSTAEHCAHTAERRDTTALRMTMPATRAATTTSTTRCFETVTAIFLATGKGRTCVRECQFTLGTAHARTHVL